MLSLKIALISTVSFASLSGPLSAAAAAACGEEGRPPCTILRPDRAVEAPPADPLAPECVVAIGGFGSDNNDGTFDHLLAWATEGSSYRTYRFGKDRSERFAYDTTGPIDVSGYALRRLVRELGEECRAVDVITHSMGGAVADRAFSLGLSRADRVATYVALSSPHNGATLAKALRRPIEADPLMALEISVLARTLGQPDPTSPAGRDLARIARAPRPPRVEAALRLRLATDAMVLERDDRDRRLDVRIHFPSWSGLEGHGGILTDDTVAGTIRTTIATHAPAADARSDLERSVAGWVSAQVDEKLSALYQGLSRHLTDLPYGPYELAAAYATVRIPQAVAKTVAEARALFPLIEPLPLVAIQ